MLFLFFFLSGATALLYQVAFGKELGTIFGATAHAVSAVLAAFMGGLALGSYLGGRFADRIARPFRAYGVAEVAVGLVCAVTPWLFDAIEPAYVAAVRSAPDSLPLVSAVRALLAGAVVIVPTLAMGMTLPWLARVVRAGADAGGAGRRLTRLYAVNTAGGAVGSLASAYFALPTLGVTGTMRAAAIVNLAIGVTAIAAGGPRVVAAQIPPGRASAPREIVPAVVAFASGVLVFSSEVVDTHLLAVVVGNSAYAFGLMLAVFLACLGLGAALADRVRRRLGVHALAASLTATAAVSLVTLPLWGEISRVFVAVAPWAESWAARELVRALVAVVLLAPATTLMGLTFPLLLRRVAARPDVARQVGRLAALNTLGSIAGALAAGYFLLPRLGSEGMLRAIAVAFAAIAAMAGLGASRRWLAAPAAAVLIAVIVPSWSIERLTSGANVYFAAGPAPEAVELVREDVHGGFTTVVRHGGVRTLLTNGKFQGDDGGELTAQRSFAHFPALFVSRYRRALVIGLGTGTTLGTVAAYPFERIDVVEISPAIVEAAREFYGVAGRHALDDPRVTLTVTDGRNFLLLAQERFDLVTIELSSVWFAGAASLYSRELYEIAAARLSEGGVIQQWLQLHHIRREEVAAVLRTIRSVFPHLALFVAGNQGIIVASPAPLSASRSDLAALSARPEVVETLGEARSLEALLDHLMISGPELDRFLEETSGPPVISTDDNLYLEYQTPKGNVMDYHASLARTIGLLSQYRERAAVGRHLR
jgi:spermidine synthase